MARKIVAGNWKMNKTVNEGVQLVEELKNELAKVDTSDVTVVVSPPYVNLSEAVKTAQGSPVNVSAQNVHQEESGAYTGEISAQMLKSVGVGYVIIGHSERREYFGENATDIAKKVDAVITQGLTPIYCCGEVKEERESGNQNEVVGGQISSELFHLSPEDFGKVVIAYEPVWAIGTGLTASPDQAQDMHAFIRDFVSEKYGQEIAEETSILYGGSCKPSNAAEIFSKKDVDGGLIGGASLKAEDFVGIITAFN
ncbi:MAG: triose-phosphate isomerase [Flavobacteriales bacterium]|nr:triose-phosphate isomerase [Flavobacteriales bacterium]|tara:strand:- start:3680 stop:4441 length:762 start_codon:yes stop_codon:yes gene_type:complete